MTVIAAPGQRPEVAERAVSSEVDLELVIAVDISYSMDLDELAVQREGYAQAIVSEEFLQALRAGPKAKISVTYFEWSTSSNQKIIIPWRIVDGPETADAVANEIMSNPVRRGSRTSISGAILFATPLFDENPYRGLRRVIDISGDGPNNDGPPVTPVRDQALAKGIVINGLPVMMMSHPIRRWRSTISTGTMRIASSAVQARLSSQSRRKTGSCKLKRYWASPGDFY
jgi:hypothetical protein